MIGAADLYRLQELDLATDAALTALAAVEGELGRDEEVAAARRDVQEQGEALARLQRSQQDRELAAETLRTRAKAAERKLYDGSVRNPRELTDLQQDLEVLTRHLRGEEDQLLGFMLQAEEDEAGLRAAEAALAELEGRWQRQQEELRGQQTALQAELGELATKRASEAGGVEVAVMALYDVLRERRQGRAVAKVERGMCQGCRITLPMSVLQRVRQGTDLVQCTSCERILYMD